MMTDTEIRVVLNGKRILFVDDTPRTLAPIPGDLAKKYGVSCDIVKELATARQRMENRDPPAHAVVLDLNMNATAADRKGFNTGLKVTHMNDGQLLGVWLAEKKIPYLYLTAVQEAFDYQLPGQENPVILSKFTVSLGQLAGELAKLLIPGL
ncbi:hypothetical protein [Candidatus Magnetaquicoccus inordinatus]|uniref:hypothetical protein n=1 Tax=Candidatus Magnetaquicoccus inordinatus TaxID=2496818 RepID=UPI00102D13FB|nr:hypothetical protein [Candidatus Magnetaquicoccus inordinatus]